MATTPSAPLGRDQVSRRVNDVMVSRYGEAHGQYTQGFVATQSLRRVMEFIDPEDIIVIDAGRSIQDSAYNIPVGGPVLRRGFIYQHSNGRAAMLHWDKRRIARNFDWDDCKEILDDAPDIYDLPVTRIVYKFPQSKLRTQLLDLLKDAVGFADPGEFIEPFVAELRAEPAGKSPLEKRLKADHDDRYYMSPKNTDRDGNRGMGWQYNTLDLKGIWSHRSFTGSGNLPPTNISARLTMHDIEELAFNNLEAATPIYGAVNSMLVYNKWRSTFGRGLTDAKRYQWQKADGWTRV